jgi:hypothetical protein
MRGELYGPETIMPPKNKRKRGKEEAKIPSKKAKKDEGYASLEDDTDDEDEQEEHDRPSLDVHTPMKEDWVDGLLRGEGIPAKAYSGGPQKKKLNWHITGRERGVIGSKKLVPPMHSQWDTTQFYVDMPFGEFLATLGTPIEGKDTFLEIMKWEIDLEVDVKWKVTTGGMEETDYFQKRMQWTSWSAMLQLELCYPDKMINCQGFPTCYENMWINFMNEMEADTVLDASFKTEFDEVLRTTLTVINKIVQYIWADAGAIEPQAVRQMVTNKTLNHVRQGKLFKFRYGELTAKELQRVKQELVRSGPLSVPDLTAGALRKGGQDRLENHLTHPQTIPEAEITAGVRKLVQQIWGEEMDTSGTINLEETGSHKLKGLTDKAKAALCLIELMCGSRAVGIMYVNFFTRLEGATMAEWEKDKTRQFGAYNRCVRVTRLSKEGTKAARAEKHQTAMDEVVDRVIVKPLNTHFVNRAFLMPELHATKGTDGIIDTSKWTGDTQAVSIFLALVTALRQYVFRPHRAPARGAESMFAHGMVAMSDDQVENMPKRVREYLAGLVNSANLYARTKFPFFRKGKGTHLFRKIYVNWAFNAFASTTMKEVGFASEVLGHRGYKVSLNYVSLIIKPSFSGELKDHVTTRQALSDMTNRVDALVLLVVDRENENEKQVAELAEQVETVMMNQGRVLYDILSRLKSIEKEKKKEEEVRVFDKLRRAKRGASEEEHLERGRRKLAELQEAGITPTYRLLRKLGVNSKVVQKVMTTLGEDGGRTSEGQTQTEKESAKVLRSNE